MIGKLITVVIPCYNESGCLVALIQRIRSALAFAGVRYELLLVDDGSIDNTASVIEELRQSNRSIGVLRFARNFGQQAALNAGLERARGDAVIVMDADLQHPPELLPQLVREWLCGYDVVQAVRRKQPGLTKSITSRAFYHLLNWISDVHVDDGAADFRLLSRRALDVLLAMPERSRFLRGLIAWMNLPTKTVYFAAPPRFAGRSAYSVRKMLHFAAEGIVSLSGRPLHLALYLGGATLVLAFAYAFFIVGELIRGIPLVRGWASTIMLTLIMGSVNLVCTGILGIYLNSVLREIRRRPSYIISEFSPAETEQHAQAV
jgi:dolichol-phosphate mannosyltransferase